MEYIFKTNDDLQAKQMIKANDMAMMIWELYHNRLKKFCVKDRGEILSLFDEYNIKPNELSY